MVSHFLCFDIGEFSAEGPGHQYRKWAIRRCLPRLSVARTVLSRFLCAAFGSSPERRTMRVLCEVITVNYPTDISTDIIGDYPECIARYRSR